MRIYKYKKIGWKHAGLFPLGLNLTSVYSFKSLADMKLKEGTPTGYNKSKAKPKPNYMLLFRTMKKKTHVHVNI